ncbi:MAG TPA: DinB family protein [Terriglobia bacterium]|nr:DinB family protein [Terriglobia bacterium]
MRYDFLIDTYSSEILKVLSVWSMFRDEDLTVRPHPTDRRGRSVREHMIHQCVGEDAWFRNMLGIDIGASPLPVEETRGAFIQKYAEDSERRASALGAKPDEWWEQDTTFFKVTRSRAWVMTRRIAHTAHHRGQQMAMLRMLNRDLHSNYGPTADTGGLPGNAAVVIYAYPDLEAIMRGGPKSELPGPGSKPVSERPDV